MTCETSLPSIIAPKRIRFVAFLVSTALILISQFAFAADGAPTIGTLHAAKVLFLGNSITLHGPKADIGWTGNWGMAASEEAKDYVHLLTADIARAAGTAPQTMVRNISHFEREYETVDPGAELREALDFHADIVVVAIGENVPEPTEETAKAKFAAAFSRLLATVNASGHPAIFVRSCFWPDEVKDGIMRKASAEAGATWVDIAALGRNEANAARSERKIEHAGVAGHPGDKGMRAIADALFSAIKKRAPGSGNTAAIPMAKLEKDGYDWEARHAQVLREKDALNPDVVLIGDSITHFWGGAPASRPVNGAAAWQATFGNYRTLNLGFGWDRTQNVLWRIDHGELDGLHPRVLVLHIGTNNTSETAKARMNTAPEIAEGIRAIVERVHAKTPQTHIVLMAVFPREERPDHPRRKLISEVNGLLPALCKDPTVTFLDIGPKLLQPDGTLSRDIMPDLCHPGEKGYAIWGAALAPLLAANISASVEGPKPERLALWPDQAPIGDGKTEAANAYITVYRPAKPNGTAAVICPGGGYGGLVTGPEGSGIAQWLNAHGITGIVLEYRLPRGRAFVPLLDAQRAIRTVRSKAVEWNCDPQRIGIIGFSAGGHLASTAATHFDTGDAAASDPIGRASSRPDFAVLVYPVISMGEKGHAGSRRNLLGPEATPGSIDLFSNEKQVTAQTPPTYLAHAVDDHVVSIEHSRMFHEALKAKGVATECLELPSGDHGLNGYKGPMWDAWQSGALKWLAAQKVIPADAAGTLR